MARITAGEIERLKEGVDLADLVTRSGVALKKAGGDLVGRCPFHEDDTPSLVVTPAKGLWHCMGACQRGGSVIDWVMVAQGVSFRHAVELLRAGEVPVVSGARRSNVRRLPAPVEADASDTAALAQVVDYYHRTLLDSPEALAYLATRKIDGNDVIERFRLGYANRTLGLRLANKQTKTGAAIRGQLARLGVYRTSGHEHLAGSVVVPVIDASGTVTDLYGRKITPNLKAGTPLHLYLPGPHRGVWNEEGLAGGEVILAESLIDALTFFSAGFEHVTASYGTSGFTAAHTEAFARHGVARVLVAYDHDTAGDKAAAALATELMASGIECFRVVLPLGTDVNDVAVAAANPRDALGRLVRGALWMGAGTATTRHRADRVGEGDVADGQGDAEIVEGDVGRRVEPGRGDVCGTVSPGQGDTPAGSADVPVPSSAAVSPVPPATPPTPPATAATHDELVVEIGRRRWRVRHIGKAPTPGVLRVNVMVAAGERFHVDVLDLYAARQRSGFVESAAKELHADRDQLTAELGQVLLATESAQAAASAQPAESAPAPMSASDRDAALALLHRPDLLDAVADAYRVLGVVGEETSALVAWLVLTSRLSDRPLGAVIQSSSSAGKSTLADAALALMPTEECVSYSAMTGQALYYLGESDLCHKVLAIAEEEGATRASYALKLLVSEGRLSIAAAGKDPATGRLTTSTYEVSGPVALLMTTTSPEIDEELANRLLVLAVDEGRSQTRAVHAAQREAETIEGLVARARRAEVTALHANAQRLLAPVAVVNPHAPSLSFADRATRNRRDNAKYLGIIRAVALAHQHQRTAKQVTVEGSTVTYIEATEGDVAAAESICAGVLDTTTDELSPSTRRLLGAVVDFAATHGGRFTRRELREATGLGDSQLKVHLARLVDLEYVMVERAGPSTSYELVADPGTVTEPAYDSDRPVGTGDRPGAGGHRPVGTGDRPGIGRFSRRSADGPSSEVSGGEADEDVLSAGIGRLAPVVETPPPSRENDPIDADRPGLRQIRGTGDSSDPRVVVAAAAP